MPTSRTDLPERVTLPLLTLITASSLDEDYQHVADRRTDRPGAGPHGSDGPRSYLLAGVVVALFGLLIVVAAMQTSRNAESSEAGRQELIRQIQDERDALADKQQTLSDLAEESTRISGTVERLSARERNEAARLLDLEGLAGFVPVSGSGVRMKVDNAPNGSTEGVVHDEDLALLVDGLWSAGAEAIAINGHRLTALTGIRNIGLAIHVKTQPLKPPYVVLAIGDPNTMQASLVESGHGAEWLNLVRLFGFEWSIDNANNLSLPAARSPQLRGAKPIRHTSDKSPQDGSQIQEDTP